VIITVTDHHDDCSCIQGKVYSGRIRSCMLHRSETWPVRKENELSFARAEMTMLRWMCAVCQIDRYSSVVYTEI